MSNKATSIYFFIFAVLYFVYTTFVVGHGIHFVNSFFTLFGFALSGYYYRKYYLEKKK